MRRAQDLLLLVGGLLILASVPLIGARYFGRFPVDFGPIDAPNASYLAFSAFYVTLGSLGALVVTIAWGRLLRPQTTGLRWTRALTSGRERTFLAVTMLVAFVAPLVIRTAVLRGMPVTDDEGTYVFAARLLLEGRIWADPPPHALFFERQFMLVGDRWFTQYPLGWPALLAPFVSVGIPGLANPFYSAMTVWLGYCAARRLVGRRAARLSVLLCLLSPQLLFASATLLSHSSCLMLLCAALLLGLRIRDGVASLRDHSLLALTVSTAFFVRPATATGFALPVVLIWLVSVSRSAGQRRSQLLAFAVPALIMASAFLYVNTQQTGSPWRTAYDEVLEHHLALGNRFAVYPPPITEGRSVFQPGDWGRTIALAGIAVLRLNLSSLGWPASLMFLPFAWGRRGAPVLWAILATFWLLQAQSPGLGIDIFGPTHFVEAVFPIAVLSSAGILRLAAWLRRVGGGVGSRAPVIALLTILTLLATLLYFPRLASAIGRSSKAVEAVLTIPARTGMGRAVLFAPNPLWDECQFQPGSYVLFRPTNDPSLDDEVLWVNDLGPALNQMLMKRFPDRAGWVLRLDASCQVGLAPLQVD